MIIPGGEVEGESTCVLTGNMDFKTPETQVSLGMRRVRKWKVHEMVHQKRPLWGTDLRGYKERTPYNGQKSEDSPDHVQPLPNLTILSEWLHLCELLHYVKIERPPILPDSSHLGQLK